MLIMTVLREKDLKLGLFEKVILVLVSLLVCNHGIHEK